MADCLVKGLCNKQKPPKLAQVLSVIWEFSWVWRKKNVLGLEKRHLCRVWGMIKPTPKMHLLQVWRPYTFEFLYSNRFLYFSLTGNYTILKMKAVLETTYWNGHRPIFISMLTPRFLAQPKLCAFPLNMLFFHSFVHFLVNAHVHSFGNLTLFCFLFVMTGTEQGYRVVRQKAQTMTSHSWQLRGVSI